MENLKLKRLREMNEKVMDKIPEKTYEKLKTRQCSKKLIGNFFEERTR